MEVEQEWTFERMKPGVEEAQTNAVCRSVRAAGTALLWTSRRVAALTVTRVRALLKLHCCYMAGLRVIRYFGNYYKTTENTYP